MGLIPFLLYHSAIFFFFFRGRVGSITQRRGLLVFAWDFFGSSGGLVWGLL